MSLRFAGIAWRTVALLIDLVVVGVYWWVVLFGPWAGTVNSLVLSWIAILPTLLYFPLAWGRFGTTIGMRLLGLRIVRGRDGGPIGFGASLIRFVGVLVLVVASAVLVGLGLLTLPLVLDQRRRGLYDRAAGTVVTRPAYRSQPSTRTPAIEDQSRPMRAQFPHLEGTPVPDRGRGNAEEGS